MRLSMLFAGLLLVSLASPATAQFTLQIDTPQSSFTWNGNTSLGPLVGNPSQDFQLVGTVEMALGAGGAPVGTGQIHSAVAAVVPDLAGKIPNVFPFLPPLATVDVTNLVLDASSDPFAVAPGGSFTTNIVLTALSGVMTVTPLGSTPTVQDLTGAQSTPTQTTGSLTQAGSTITLTMPVNSTFDFHDPDSGVSGTLTVVGTLVASYECPAPASYCTTTPNSVGPGALMSSTGSTSVTANDLVLRATGAPPQRAGLFFYGPLATQVPFGDGTRCVAPGTLGLFRMPVGFSSPGGVFTRALNHDNLPNGNSITPGQTWLFQSWYRDPEGGPAGFNLSDGLRVTFCP